MAQRDDSFFNRLTRLFRSGPSIRRKVKGYDESGYYNKRIVSPHDRGGIGIPMHHQSNQLNLFGSDMNSRMVRYQEFAEMEYSPIISKALDIIADEACSGDENGKNFHVFSNNPEIKAALEELFFDVLNVDFHLRVWIRNLIKYGDCFLYNEVAPGVGIVNASNMLVIEVDREEGFDKNDPYAVRFKWNRYGQSYLENWQVTHFRILGNDLFFPFGTSMLESARRIWRQYVMMIDAMMVYRLVRSPERRVHYIDIAGQDATSVDNYMNNFIRLFKGNRAVDKATGRQDTRFNPIGVDEDYYIPVRGANSGTKVDTLPGGQHMTATEDIELIQNQLFAALGVPKAYLGYDENLSCVVPETPVDLLDGRTLTIEEIKTELDNQKEIWVYSVDPETHEMKPGKVIWAGPTRANAELVRVTLDNGMSFDTTPDHKWMARDGSWCEAGKLTPGQSLMPLYTRNKQLRQGSNYQQVFDPRTGKWLWTHQMVANQPSLVEVDSSVKASSKHVVHHKDFNRFNNNPGNLLKMDWEAHRKLHEDLLSVTKAKALLEGKYNGLNNGYASKCRKDVEHLWSTQKLISWCLSNKPTSKKEIVSGFGLTELQLHRLLKENNLTYPEFARDYVFGGYKLSRKGVGGHTYPNYKRILPSKRRKTLLCEQCNSPFEVQQCRSKKFCDWVCYKQHGIGRKSSKKVSSLNGLLNHKVVSVVPLNERRQTWCMEVAGTHNFALSKSSIISNSKATLAQEDIRFSRTIQILQKIIISELNKLAILHLYAKGFDGKDLIDFELKLSNPSSVALQQKLDLWKTKIDVIGSIEQLETKYLPRDWVYKEILNFSDGDITWVKEKLKEDKKFAAELDAITEPDRKNSNMVDPFDTTKYNMIGGTPTPGSVNNGINQSPENKVSIPEPETLGTSSDDLPIKDNPRVQMDKYNSSRRKSDTAKLTTVPNFKQMLNPNSQSQKDIYDLNFLRKPLSEDAKLSNLITRDALLSKEMQVILARFDEHFKAKEENEKLKLLVEDSDPLTEEVNLRVELLGDVDDESATELFQDKTEENNLLEKLLTEEISDDPLVLISEEIDEPETAPSLEELSIALKSSKVS